MNGGGQLINGGLCGGRRKRGNSELDEDDVKKSRNDPSMPPFTSPVAEMNQEFSVPGKYCCGGGGRRKENAVLWSYPQIGLLQCPQIG